MACYKWLQLKSNEDGDECIDGECPSRESSSRSITSVSGIGFGVLFLTDFFQRGARRIRSPSPVTVRHELTHFSSAHFIYIAPSPRETAFRLVLPFLG